MRTKNHKKDLIERILQRWIEKYIQNNYREPDWKEINFMHEILKKEFELED